MNSLGLRHPSDEELLRYADGELPARERERIRNHLEACWQCRNQLKEFEGTIGEYIRYRQTVLDPSLPPPPAPWFDIYHQFDRIDESEAGRSAGRRAIKTILAWVGRPARWVPVAVTLLLVAFVVHELRDTPSVRAATLLRKAVAAAEVGPQSPRRVQIKTRRRSITRVIGAAAMPAKDANQTNAELEALFRSGNFDWNDPLSARSFQSWRAQLAEKHDEVSSESGLYQIRTSTSSGELLEATLRLNAGNFRAVEETLRFRNELVEITELEYPAPATATGGVVAAAPPAPHPASAGHFATPAPAEATPGDELRVMAALHRAGADLGEPVEVSRSGSTVVVSGVAIPAERQQRIREELQSLPRVELRFSETGVETAAPPAQAEEITVGAVNGKVQAQIEKELGGRAAYEEFSDRVLESTDAFMSRAHALRRLAERFTPEAESRMSPADRNLLTSLRREHAAALLREVKKVQDRVQPLFGASDASDSVKGPAVTPPATWQDASKELFQEARRCEGVLSSMLGGTTEESQLRDLEVQVLTCLAQLKTRAEHYERLATMR